MTTGIIGMTDTASQKEDQITYDLAGKFGIGPYQEARSMRFVT